MSVVHNETEEARKRVLAWQVIDRPTDRPRLGPVDFFLSSSCDSLSA